MMHWLSNADEWAEIESFAKKKEAWLRRYLELPYGIPTDDTYRIVIGNINVEHFFRVTVQLLIDTVDRILSITGNEGNIHEKGIASVDGKVSCGSARKETQDGEVKALQTLNVYSADYGICLGQKFIGEKTNEIPAAQEILRLRPSNRNMAAVLQGSTTLPSILAGTVKRKSGKTCAVLGWCIKR